MPADLHIHSNFSDGTNSPEEIAALAAQAGLTAIALTDHDTVDGIERAQKAGAERGIEVIPGVELTTESPRCEAHILGYFIDCKNPQFLEVLGKIQAGRVKRIYKIVKKLNALRLDISAQEVFEVAGKAAPGRPHVARALLNRGYVGSYKEAFNRYLDFRSPAYVPHYKLTAAEAVRLVVEAGGLAVFAHPLISNCDAMIPELIAAGLKGLEVYYPGYLPEKIEHYSGLAKKLGLLVSGGTDFHGIDSGRDVKLGQITLADELMDKIRNEHLRGN